MKYGDIQKLHDAGLITDEQRRKIIEHFNLKEDGGNKFLAIISIIGAVLIAAGIALLISAHWNEIPRGVKIAGGLALMLGLLTRAAGGCAKSRENIARPARRCSSLAPACSSPTSRSSARFTTSSRVRRTPFCFGGLASPRCRGCCAPRPSTSCCCSPSASGSVWKSTSATA